MLGLIAFALLILACSYWKLSGQLEISDATSERDLEAGADDSTGDLKPPPVFEEKILVIMAGQEKPTYLATPIGSRASSFGSNTSCSTETTDKSDKTAEKSENDESLDQVQRSNIDNHDTTVRVP